MAKPSLGKLAYYLVLIGAILLVVFGIASLVGFAITIPFRVFGGLFAFGAIVEIIAGIIAFVGAKRATELVWAIILIIIGLVAGGIGGLLVLLGGIVGLVARYV